MRRDLPLTRDFVRCTRFFTALVLVTCLPGAVRASDFATYALAETFNFPTIADPADQGPVVFDNLSDGRLLAVSTLVTDASFPNLLGEPKVYLESSPGSRNFQLLGDLPLPSGGLWSSGGGAFLDVSPGTSGGVRIAVGNNRAEAPLVGVFAEADLLNVGPATMPISWFEVDHFSAAWANDTDLAINSGDFLNSQINLLDTDSTPGLEVNPVILNGVEGASGDVGFDAAGNLYTSNGFENSEIGGSATGHVRRFDFNDWDAAISGSPLNFETDGTPIDTVLSGGSLEFDQEQSLLVGGSNFFGGGDADFFALLPGPGLGSIARTFDPDTSATSFYTLVYNDVLGEFYAYEPFALDFPANIDNTLAFVFRPGESTSAAIPEPSTGLLLVIGIVISRRKPHRRQTYRRAVGVSRLAPP